MWKAGQWGPVSAAVPPGGGAPGRLLAARVLRPPPSPPACTLPSRAPPHSLVLPHQSQGAGRWRPEGLGGPIQGTAPARRSAAHFHPREEGRDALVTLVPGKCLPSGTSPCPPAQALGPSVEPKSLVSPRRTS